VIEPLGHLSEDDLRTILGGAADASTGTAGEQLALVIADLQKEFLQRFGHIGTVMAFDDQAQRELKHYLGSTANSARFRWTLLDQVLRAQTTQLAALKNGDRIPSSVAVTAAMITRAALDVHTTTVIERYQQRYKERNIALSFAADALARIIQHTKSDRGGARQLALVVDQVLAAQHVVLSAPDALVTGKMVEEVLDGPDAHTSMEKYEPYAVGR